MVLSESWSVGGSVSLSKISSPHAARPGAHALGTPYLTTVSGVVSHLSYGISGEIVGLSSVTCMLVRGFYYFLAEVGVVLYL